MRLVRPALIASFVLVACLSVAGCVSSAAAGWTFAPPPSATPVPSVSGSAVPSAATSAAPASAATGSAAPSGGAAADVTISASNIAFEQSSVNAPAGKAFTILFDNKDASVPHDVYIKDAGGTQVFAGSIVTGPAQTTYNVPSLAAGTYTFFCSIHSNMTGTMVVQ
ncbi:MAG TPA: cupredoxin domain-containing protein [Candidatus Limnocylindrales bacterium]|nr:cupredoxin domain-containing protein [Candidatus Limnocylindrales bacterium]